MRLKIFHDKIAPPGKTANFFTKDEGMAKVRERKWAFFTEGATAYKAIEETFFEHEKCGLQQIEYLEIVEPHQALKKNSPLKEIVKVQ